MTMLSAFVFDPVTSWRLVQDHTGGPRRHQSDEIMQQNPVSRPQPRVQAESPARPSDLHARVANERAMTVINRVQQKLAGTEFKNMAALDVPAQVDMLIRQATSIDNLSQVRPLSISSVPLLTKAAGFSCI